MRLASIVMAGILTAGCGGSAWEKATRNDAPAPPLPPGRCWFNLGDMVWSVTETMPPKKRYGELVLVWGPDSDRKAASVSAIDPVGADFRAATRAAALREKNEMIEERDGPVPGSHVVLYYTGWVSGKIVIPGDPKFALCAPRADPSFPWRKAIQACESLRPEPAERPCDPADADTEAEAEAAPAPDAAAAP